MSGYSRCRTTAISLRVARALTVCAMNAVVPVVLNDSDAEAQLRGLRSDPLFTTTRAARAAGLGAGATSASALDDELAKRGSSDSGWRLAASEAEEWSAWLFLLKVEKGLDAENFYVQVHLSPMQICRCCVFARHNGSVPIPLRLNKMAYLATHSMRVVCLQHALARAHVIWFRSTCV